MITGGNDSFIIIWKDNKQFKSISIETDLFVKTINLSIDLDYLLLGGYN
jgi:hypothetical protein